MSYLEILGMIGLGLGCGLSKLGIPAALVFSPILAGVYGGKASAGIIIIPVIVSDLIVMYIYRKNVDKKVLIKILPLTILGIIAAVIFGNNISDELFKRSMGIIIFIIGVLTLLKNFKIDFSKLSFLFGFLGGIAAFIGNVSGPMMSIYLLNIEMDREKFLGTRTWFYFIINLIKEYPQVENNLSTASYLLFALLEQNGNTQELERYMRYTLAELSGYQYLTDNSKELEINFAVGLSLDSLYSYNYDGSTSGYTVDVDSYATSSASGKKSGGSGRTAWHLEKLTTITTTDQDGKLIVSREYHYFKQEKGTNICGRTSLATCLSGLGVVNPSTGQPYTPTEISPEATDMWFSWAQSVAGVSATKYTNNIRTKLTEHLTAGNPAIVHIKANSDPYNPYNTGGGHFIAVVGIKFSGDTLVYVLDPGSSRTNRTENYININTVLEYADEVRLFSK